MTNITHKCNKKLRSKTKQKKKINKFLKSQNEKFCFCEKKKKKYTDKKTFQDVLLPCSNVIFLRFCTQRKIKNFYSKFTKSCE